MHDDISADAEDGIEVKIAIVKKETESTSNDSLLLLIFMCLLFKLYEYTANNN